MQADVEEWGAEAHTLNSVKVWAIIPRKKAEALPEAGKKITVEIKQYRQKRTLTANAYMWLLCDRIAAAIDSDKDEVYRAAIKKRAPFESLRVRKEAAPRLCESWESKGIGWVAEKAGEDMRFEYVNLYYGSSSFTTEEMARVIDWLVDEAQGLGIDTRTPQETAAMLEEWRQEHDVPTGS